MALALASSGRDVGETTAAGTLATANINTGTGNPVVLGIMADTTSTTIVSSVTDGASNTYAALLTAVAASANCTLSVWAMSGASPTGLVTQAITVHFASSVGASFIYGEISGTLGHTLSSLLDQHATQGSAALGSAITTSATPAQSATNDFAVAFLACESGTLRNMTGGPAAFTAGAPSTAVPSTTTFDANTVASHVLQVNLGVLALATSAAQTYSGTLNQNANFAGAIFTLLQPSAATAPVSPRVMRATRVLPFLFPGRSRLTVVPLGPLSTPAPLFARAVRRTPLTTPARARYATFDRGPLALPVPLFSQAVRRVPLTRPSHVTLTVVPLGHAAATGVPPIGPQRVRREPLVSRSRMTLTIHPLADDVPAAKPNVILDTYQKLLHGGRPPLPPGT
jgi:hypothetical protein